MDNTLRRLKCTTYLFVMMKKILFDLDGTLLDTLEDLAEAVNFSLRKHNEPERALMEVRSMVGNGVYVLMERALNGGKNNLNYTRCLADFQGYYKEHMLDHTRPYQGIMDMLKELKSKGIKMAIVSNKFDAAVKGLNEDFFSDYIDIAIGEMEAAGIRKKPAPDTLIKAMQSLDSDKTECIYVGDSEVDLQTAANAGLDCICVDWGFRTHDYIAAHGGDIIVSDASEVTSLIIGC